MFKVPGLGNIKPSKSICQAFKSWKPCKCLMTIMTYHRGKSVLVGSRGEGAPGPMLSHLQNSSLGLSLQSLWKSTLLWRNPIFCLFCLFEGFPRPFVLKVGNVCKNLVVGVFVKSWSTNWPHCVKRNKLCDDQNEDEKDNEGMFIGIMIMSCFARTIPW